MSPSLITWGHLVFLILMLSTGMQMSWQDCRNKKIDAFLVYRFTATSWMCIAVFVGWEWLTFSWAFLSLFLLGLGGYGVVRKKIGQADLWIFGACLPWLSFDEIPFFLTLSGILGLGVGRIWRVFDSSLTFPFVPCLLLALILVKGVSFFSSNQDFSLVTPFFFWYI